MKLANFDPFGAILTQKQCIFGIFWVKTRFHWLDMIEMTLKQPETRHRSKSNNLLKNQPKY